MTTSSVAPAARPIPGHSRLTGELVALTPSCTTPGLFHITTQTTCSCKGFSYRKRCSHLASIDARSEPLPCVCGNYHLTDADRVKAHPDARRDLAPGGVAWLAVQKAAGGWPR
jgi:hypothetical protein